MTAFVRAGLWERALDVMATAKEKGVRLTEGSYTAGLMACEKGGQWALALELLKEMHLVGMSPSTFAYNAAIFSCRKDRQWVQVRRGAVTQMGFGKQFTMRQPLFAWVEPRGVCRDVESWDSVQHATLADGFMMPLWLSRAGHRTAGRDEAGRQPVRSHQLSRRHGTSSSLWTGEQPG